MRRRSSLPIAVAALLALPAGADAHGIFSPDGSEAETDVVARKRPRE